MRLPLYWRFTEINIDFMITISRLINRIPYKLFILTFCISFFREGSNETSYRRVKFVQDSLSDLTASASAHSNAHARDLLWQPRAVVPSYKIAQSRDGKNPSVSGRAGRYRSDAFYFRNFE